MAETIAGDGAAAVARHLRRAGLPELCPPVAQPKLRRAVPWALPLVLWIGTAPLTDKSRPAWQQATGAAVVLVSFLVFAAVVANRCARLRPRSETLSWLVFLLMLGLGMLVVAIAAGAATGGLSALLVDGPTRPLDAGDLAVGLAAAGVYLAGALGGLDLARAVLVRAASIRAHDLRAGIAATPEMLFLVAFVIILGDVWKVLAPLQGWRVEVLLIGCVVLCGTALGARARKPLRTLWHLDVHSALAAARERADTADLVRDVADESLPATMTMRRHARWNVALVVILPILVRLLIAGLVLALLLFVIGLLVMDPKHLGEEIGFVPGTQQPIVQLPIATAKVAVMLSALATLVIAVTDHAGGFRAMAERRVAHLLADAGVWAAHSGRREGVPAAEPVTEATLAPTPLPG